MTAPRVLVIACGALARELLAITELNGLVNVTVECLPASLHNRPKEIPELVRQRIHRARGKDDMLQDDMVPGTNSSTGASPPGDNQLLDAGTEPAAGTFDQILIGYADSGAHCYQFFATAPRFDELQDHALGSFYLTDFLARNWERLIWDGMGIAKHPELRDMYFGNYTRCVYLEQTDDPKARAAAHECADRLGLELHIEHTGYGELESTMVDFTRKATA